jgi:hypothetical protein
MRADHQEIHPLLRHCKEGLTEAVVLQLLFFCVWASLRAVAIETTFGNR